MFKFDDNFLESVGLASMPEDQKRSFLRHVSYELESRVGNRLSEGMSDEKLQEVEKVNNPQDVMIWLETNCPDYEQVVTKELVRLRQELIENRNRILSAESPI